MSVCRCLNSKTRKLPPLRSPEARAILHFSCYRALLAYKNYIVLFAECSFGLADSDAASDEGSQRVDRVDDSIGMRQAPDGADVVDESAKQW